MDDDPVVDRLDKLIALISLAFADPIARARQAARSDPVVAALLDACADGWTLAATARSAATAAGASTTTAGRRVAELVAAGALKRRGATTTTEYRSTGIY